MPAKKDTVLDLNYGNHTICGYFVHSIITGKVPWYPDQDCKETIAFGSRSDGKTFGALVGMIGHAKMHEMAGFDLPTRWVGIRDSFTNHKLTTFETLKKPIWMGGWTGYDGGHIWIFSQVVGGKKKQLVKLDLYGIEDPSANDKLRIEANGVWFEEVAPAAGLITSSGLSETSFNIAITSMGSRAPTHARVAVISTNYPDEDHWSWTRFKPGEGTYGETPGHPERLWFRIPPGERATAEDRAVWSVALADRPDLLARLVNGQPGQIQLGPQVAVGFNLDRHVARERIPPNPGHPLYLGQDFGHTPTVVIGQQMGGYIYVVGCFSIERGGVKQLYENEVIPWFSHQAPWALKNENLIIGQYDGSAADEETDIEQNPAEYCRSKVPGYWMPGPSGSGSWDRRKGPMLASMNKAVGGNPALHLCPVGAYPLKLALGGRWYYPMNRLGQVSRDLPKKPNHPWEDYGDAFCYMLCAMGVQPESNIINRAQPVVESVFDPRFSKEVKTDDFNEPWDPRFDK